MTDLKVVLFPCFFFLFIVERVRDRLSLPSLQESDPWTVLRVEKLIIKIITSGTSFVNNAHRDLNMK